VFQIAMTYAERADAPVSAAGVEFLLTDLVVGIKAAKSDLAILAEARSDGLWFECTYKTALFDAVTVERLLGNWEVLLAGVVADPGARLSQLPVLTQRELDDELAGWNDTAASFPVMCIHEGFEAQVARTPEAVAAEFEGERVSYAELNGWADRVAGRLRALGVGAEVLVGVCMQTGLARLAGLLGVWKAGGGYVPLDPGLPGDRLSFMIADTGMSVLLTDEASAGRVPAAGGVAVVSLDEAGLGVAGLGVAGLGVAGLGVAGLGGAEPGGGGAGPSNVAYVIYTSGSTGEPKGVVVEHGQAVNFLLGMAGPWRIGPGSVVLGFAAFTFDVSVCDMFLPLLAGGRVVLASPETLHSPPRLAALMRAAGVTYAMLPPAVLSLLVGEEFPALRTLISTGEELSSDLLRAWLRDGVEMFNGYGPTEATMGSTFARLDAGTPLPPPIGRPKPNYRVYVLDGYLNPVPVGVLGELHIGGAGVARGYLNRPELTRDRFIADPFSGVSGARLYKTGDLVRRRADGSIVFVGRADGQVKIRGLRIELGEIEAALVAHPAVAQAVVTTVTDPAGEKQLAAYLRPEPGAEEPQAADVLQHLATVLPAYMIPAYLTVMEEFPLNTNGKVDKPALPQPQAQAQAVTEHVPPATLIETVMVDMYATLLGLERVSATDSFFDIGGSSLQVMRLVDMIGKELGADLGVSAVFLHPTPRQLAASIEAAGSGTGEPGGSGSLVELSSGAGELPLFLIHAVGGTVFAYAQLAGELAGTFRVFGMQAPGLSQPGAIADSLDDLVSDYTERIRAAQPSGPYRLAGWSMGGVIAFEIARQLEQAGQQVSLLMLMDAPFSTPQAEVLTESELAGQFLAEATQSLAGGTQSLAAGTASGPPDPATASAREQLAWLAGRLADEDGDGADTPAAAADGAKGAGGTDSADRDALTAQLQRRFDIFRAHAQMLAGYQPAGPAVQAPTLIVSADNSPNAPARSRWPGVLTGPVSTQRVAGDHYSFLRSPLVAEVGSSILKWHASVA
jgi:amino acid adenylation domain-containing protein